MATQSVIYHDPNRGSSREVPGVSRESGTGPRVTKYLKTPPTRAGFKDLPVKTGITPRQSPRREATHFDEPKLDDPAKTDARLTDAILAHPILMERPVVVTDKGAAVCRPAGKVMERL
jgi:arsenate reductase